MVFSPFSLSFRLRSSRFKFGIRFVIPLAVTGVTDEIGGSDGRRRMIRRIPRDCENQVVPSVPPLPHFFISSLVTVDFSSGSTHATRDAEGGGWGRGWERVGGSASFILLDLVIGVEFSLRRRGVRPSATKLMK